MKSQKGLEKVDEFLKDGEEDHHWRRVERVEESVCFAGEKKQLILKRKM